ATRRAPGRGPGPGGPDRHVPRPPRPVRRRRRSASRQRRRPRQVRPEQRPGDRVTPGRPPRPGAARAGDPTRPAPSPPTPAGPDQTPRTRLDLRLAGFAVAIWLTAWWALHAPPLPALAAGTGAAVAAGCLWTISVRRNRSPADRDRPARTARNQVAARHWLPAVPAVVAVLLGICCGGVATGARTAVRDAPPLAALARAH